MAFNRNLLRANSFRSQTQTLILIPLRSPIEFHTRTLTLNGSQLVELGRSDATKPTSSNGYFTANNDDLNRKHAEVHSSGKNVIIKDLNSHHGTFVNNVKLGSKEQTLKSGDVLCLGKNVAGGKAVVAKVFIGIPKVTLRPEDGCTARFKESQTLSLPPGKEVAIGGTLLRDKGNISPVDKHAKLWWDSGSVFIQDLGADSPNGTIVNKTVLKKGTPYHLENGDIVRMGSHFVKMDNGKAVGHPPIIVRVDIQ